jgi:hypothetical protein
MTAGAACAVAPAEPVGLALVVTGAAAPGVFFWEQALTSSTAASSTDSAVAALPRLLAKVSSPSTHRPRAANNPLAEPL